MKTLSFFLQTEENTPTHKEATPGVEMLHKVYGWMHIYTPTCILINKHTHF